MGAGLRHQFLLRGEMAVERAVGQAGRGHDLRHRHAVDAPLAEQPGGGVQDQSAILGDLFTADFHLLLIRNMMIIIYRQS